jgi:hypothetical protein
VSTPNAAQAAERRELFAALAEDFTLYSRAYRFSMPECDPACAARMETVLVRFAAPTHYDDGGNEVPNPHAGSPDTRWDDPEDAAIAFVMAANWEAVAPSDPVLIDYFALAEGPAFVIDALVRTFKYEFHGRFDGKSHWTIAPVVAGVHGVGSVRDAAWKHFGERLDEAPKEQRSEWLPTDVASLPAMARCTLAWIAEPSREEAFAAARSLVAVAPEIARGLARSTRGPNTSDLADWVLDQLAAPSARRWPKTVVDHALRTLATAGEEGLGELGKAWRAVAADEATEWFAAPIAEALIGDKDPRAAAELEALAAAVKSPTVRKRLDALRAREKKARKGKARKPSGGRR